MMNLPTGETFPESMPVMDGLVGLPHPFNPTGWIEPTNESLLWNLQNIFCLTAMEIDEERNRYTFDLEHFHRLWQFMDEEGYQLVVSPRN